MALLAHSDVASSRAGKAGRVALLRRARWLVVSVDLMRVMTEGGVRLAVVGHTLL